jgi:hypothetical protein
MPDQIRYQPLGFRIKLNFNEVFSTLWTVGQTVNSDTSHSGGLFRIQPNYLLGMRELHERSQAINSAARDDSKAYRVS